ncbi:Serine/threonine-protein kinase 19 [Mortierella claussenii]|nr:Serine/threonine-protein kinase 19 [Mortierella claussenii]
MASVNRQTQQQKRHQLLSTTRASNEAASTSPGAAHQHGPYPTDTLSAVYYLLDMLRPSRIKQQKVFPRVCMIHQLYSIIKDHTAVDRALAQLIKEGTIRKFYLGGTGSDEFAIMLTTDYVIQIQQAKEQYLKDLKESLKETPVGTKRKLGASAASKEVSKKRTLSGNLSTQSALAASIPGNTSDTSDTGDGEQVEDTIFDRFKDLVTNGHCMEISIQHSNIQSVIGATDQDITTLIRYSLLNRSLSAPANPHLVNLNQPSGRGGGGGGHTASSSTSGGGHSALNQLIHTTNQEQAKTVKSETTSGTTVNASTSIPSSSIGITPIATTITATLGRRERISDDVAYRFAIRQGGLFVTHFLKGRLEILRMIRRQTFGDMLTSILVSKPLRGSFLPHEFHIHDVVGSGRVQSDTTTSGQMLKLTLKGEASAKAQ